MAKGSSQKFIGRNRAPRVQIEYDLELYGAEKKIQLPFVMGVMSDLSGKPGRDTECPIRRLRFLVGGGHGGGSLHRDLSLHAQA